MAQHVETTPAAAASTWTCAKCKKTGQSETAGPPLGWYAYLNGETVLEVACSDTCTERLRWAVFDSFRAVHLQAIANPTPRASGPVPLTCPACNGGRWLASMGLTSKGTTLSLGCASCRLVIRPDLA